MSIKKRIFALLLSLALLVSSVPLAVIAGGIGGSVQFPSVPLPPSVSIPVNTPLGDLQYEFDFDTLTAKVIDCAETVTAVSVLEKIMYGNYEYTVTEIGENAFAGCASLTSVVIPDSVSVIGAGAFSGCTNLDLLSLPSLVCAIGDNAFPAEMVLQVKKDSFAHEYALSNEISFTFLSTLEWITLPTKTEYYQGSSESLDLTGAKLLYTDSNGVSTELVPGVMEVNQIGSTKFGGLDETARTEAILATFSAAGVKSVRIRYGGLDVYYDITVYTTTGMTYIYNSTVGTATLINFTDTTAKTVVIPPTVTSDGVSYTVTGISQAGQSSQRNGFRGKTNLTEIVLPDTLEYIGWRSFYNTNITSMVIPAAVTEIAGEAFSQCDDLESLVFEEGSRLTTFGTKVFYKCYSMLSIDLSDTLLTALSDYLFQGAKSLSDVKLPDTVASIGTGAFSPQNPASETPNRVPLRSLVLPASLTTIGAEAFLDCRFLKQVDFSKAANLSNIGASAFEGCALLKEVVLPENDTAFTFGGDAFAGCASLTYFAVPDGTTAIPTVDRGFFDECTSLRIVSLPDTLTQVPALAFSGCTALSTVILPWTTQGSIEAGAFDSVAALRLFGTVGGVVESFADATDGITFCELSGSNVLAKAFYSSNLDLQHSISMNYYVEKLLLDAVGFVPVEGKEDLQLRLNFAFENNIVNNDGTSARNSGAISPSGVSDGFYIFTLEDVSPFRMTETITSVLTYGSFSGPASEANETSVVAYCVSLMNRYPAPTDGSTDYYRNLKNLVVDLTKYGTASQQYAIQVSGEATAQILQSTPLPTAVLEEGTSEEVLTLYGLNNSEIDPYEDVTDPNARLVLSPNATWFGASLYLMETVTMRLRFGTDLNVSDLCAVIEDENGKILGTVPGSEIEAGTNGDYYVNYSGLSVTQMRTPVYITICSGSTPVSNTLCYSIASYASNYTDDTTVIGNLIRAMMRYGDAAKTYGRLISDIDPATWVEQLLALPIATDDMTSEERRELVTEFFKLQLSFQWTPNTDVEYVMTAEKDRAIYLPTGRVYSGLTYATDGGNIYKALDYYDPETGILDVEAMGDNFLNIIASNCSNAVAGAWARLANALTIYTTEQFTPKNGALIVGDYVYPNGVNPSSLSSIYSVGTDAIITHNGLDVMYDSLAQAQPGDGLISTVGVHVRMVYENHPVYVNGEIDPDQSYIVYLDQPADGASGTRSDVYTQSNGVVVQGLGGAPFNGGITNVKLTYNELLDLETAYIPVTIAELHASDCDCSEGTGGHCRYYDATSSTIEAAEAWIVQTGSQVTYAKKSEEQIADFTPLTVEALSREIVCSNYIMSNIFVTVRDADGNEVLSYDPHVSTRNRTTNLSLEEVIFEELLAPFADGMHTVEISVRSSTGETVHALTAKLLAS